MDHTSGGKGRERQCTGLVCRSKVAEVVQDKGHRTQVAHEYSASQATAAASERREAAAAAAATLIVSRLRSFARLALTWGSMGETRVARQTGSSSMCGSRDAAPALTLVSRSHTPVLSRDNDTCSACEHQVWRIVHPCASASEPLPVMSCKIET